MSDPREVEGSAERAADRGSAAGLEVPDAGTSLAVPSVVGGVVRGYIGDVIDVRKRWLGNAITDQQAPLEIAALGDAMQRIFYGQDNRYERTAWNAPDQLGAYLVANVVGGDTLDAVVRAFNTMFSELAPDLARNEAGTIDPDMMEAVLDEIIARYTAHMLGMNPTAFE